MDFIDSIENNHFIEAHEILERSWKQLKIEAHPEEARLQKGLINGATAIGLHAQKARPEAAKKLWDAYTRKYRPLILAATDVAHAEQYREAAGILDEKWGIIGY